MGTGPYIFDGHNDLPWAMRNLCDYDLDQVELDGNVPDLQTDLPRLRAGGVGAQFWSLYVPCSLADDKAVTATLEQVDFVRRFAARYPEHLGLAATADEVEQVAASGRIACLMGIEGGHSIAGSLGALRALHHLGARYMTLTHNANVPWADSATDTPAIGGLNHFGLEVVAEMNRMGMFVDLSHVSPGVMRDALDASRAPVIFSHSSARELCDNPRNVPDDVLARLPANGGVCMVTFVPAFVSQGVSTWMAECKQAVQEAGGDPRNVDEVQAVMKERQATDPPPRCTVQDVADHVDHVRAVAGVDHVGLGGDYDGSSKFPEGMPDVSSYPLLLDVLAERGWSATDLTKLAHANVLRAMRDMEAVARS